MLTATFRGPWGQDVPTDLIKPFPLDPFAPIVPPQTLTPPPKSATTLPVPVPIPWPYPSPAAPAPKQASNLLPAVVWFVAFAGIVGGLIYASKQA